jgi:nucleoside-diphosphate-sugar epimerase
LDRSRLHGFDRRNAPDESKAFFTQGKLERIDDLQGLGNDVNAKYLVHLAAESRVVFPFSETSQFIDSNLSGMLNALEVLQPEVLVFASSSAVYGDSDAAGESTAWSNINPVGIYGMSKAMGELISAEWARASGGAAVAFRFGNVIGPRCGGFIPYLVQHAKRHPNGDVPAQCRGGGKIVRDYLPISYLIDVLQRVFDLPWDGGQLQAYNVGTGRGMTNRQVADVVRSVLLEKGLTLNINWDNPSPEAEASLAVLDVVETERRFEIETPGLDAIVDAIAAATRDLLD